MPVIFDEVVATVAPETRSGPASEERGEPAQGGEICPHCLQAELRRLQRRRERVRAD